MRTKHVMHLLPIPACVLGNSQEVLNKDLRSRRIPCRGWSATYVNAEPSCGAAWTFVRIETAHKGTTCNRSPQERRIFIISPQQLQRMGLNVGLGYSCMNRHPVTRKCNVQPAGYAGMTSRGQAGLASRPPRYPPRSLHRYPPRHLASASGLSCATPWMGPPQCS